MKKDNLKLGVLGLGYVGLPVAVAFGKKMPVMGLDVNQKRIEQLKHTHDETGEVTDEDLLSTNIDFTSDAKRLKECNFIIVAVPTPINESNQPDMRILHKASKMIGQNIQKGTTVVFESTVYPGATEEECAPIIEQWSGLVSGKDFFIGYSPERINPGDKTHTFTTILKIVSGQNEQTTERVADVYSSVVTAGVFKASSIKVAEAAKVIENTQRDLNIALMNELSQIFHELNIDTQEVLEAAGTKWNFLKFEPGLVGGHCIGVDPYYLAHKAESVGYHPEVILAGRRVNDSMAQYVGQSIVKELLKQKKHLGCLKVSVLGLTFKENVPDIRNSKVADLIQELEEYGIEVLSFDPLADADEIYKEYKIEMANYDQLTESDVVILAVPHDVLLTEDGAPVKKLLKDETSMLVDLKKGLEKTAEHSWSL
ncbi:nucleotide sugar dehydrogenase [Brochothrix thermosphacta]|uniref:Nucleotide sugar dehydrogenase n=1 Tax=Brochothrix thermosphacta TaxID=2756 RepID=A0A1D2KMW3_BROTH|nr:nucleotide sugar dehydrogenase [Brochothrix thermosphacta]ATF26550.1 nucleotide sugar dehydrogenase [Brochothrix thermosphacta]ATH85905.1 nucleotide sugar dehydrogenase [Brochothrix thermosphacta]MPQ28802.1 nucleotide sugar dehydrogenase [Brochothrix thermosphacta]ODJ53953.1 GDP-mannose dehydrogenase [Brochothrix thermosphacta]ODJ59038.1 GDP-mannose dehydrogenase [Brochothrix thermosphacta]